MSWKVRRELKILLVLLIPALLSFLFSVFVYVTEGNWYDQATLRFFVPAAVTLWLFQFIIKSVWRILRTY